ncbi:TadE/TadG family type IV pilus assembly protein [Streptomyces sp. YIM 98790]|uniref:TadE/TadG family type IV pilus assembly protein n=1 Tax=Streptomyces sp. YIM 98790 TaxID=2689077 RepID=UPI00140A5E2E|nr:TadE/TadG family type IV pilus assembly protein [Streptomyces sp. YIM 98790]
MHGITPGRAPAAGRPARRPGAGHDRDRGITAVEFAGWLPILLMVALAAIQLGLVGFAALQAGSGARTAARIASADETRDQWQQAGRQAMSDWLAGDVGMDEGCGNDGEVTVTATVTIPSVLPFFNGLGDATKTVTMPCD